MAFPSVSAVLSAGTIIFRLFQPKALRAAVAALLASVLLTESAFAYKPQANVWSDRAARRSVQIASAGMLPSAAPASAVRLNRLLSTAPSAVLTAPTSARIRSLPAGFLAHVTVKRTYGLRPGVPAVILLEDVHQNVEAQTRLSKALQSLADEPGDKPLTVALEGADKPLAFSVFHRFPDLATAAQVADAFLASGDIGGPSHAGFVARPSPGRRGLSFVPAERTDLYRRNVDAYLRSHEVRGAARSAVSDLRDRLSRERSSRFSRPLIALDDAVEGHHAGRSSLADFARALSDRAEPPLAVRQFMEAQAMERSMDLARVDVERRRVLEKLVSRLSDADIAGLVSLSVGYRDGAVTFGAYYDALKSLCRRNGVDLRATPAFDDYVRYVLLADGIDANALFSGLEEMEDAAYGRLARTENERSLVAAIRQARLAERLVEFALTSRQWTGYKAGRRVLPDIDLRPFEDFYRSAEDRDRVLASAVPVGRPAALVAGGFHTDGIADLLRRAGRPVIVCSPRLSRADPDAGSAYLSVFDRERTPLDRIFAGEKLFLASVPAGVAGQPATANLAHHVEALIEARTSDGETIAEAKSAAADLGDAARAATIDRRGDATTIESETPNERILTVVGPAGHRPFPGPAWRRQSERTIGDSLVSIFSRRRFLSRSWVGTMAMTSLVLPASLIVAIQATGLGSGSSEAQAGASRPSEPDGAPLEPGTAPDRNSSDGKGMGKTFYAAILGVFGAAGGGSESASPDRARSISQLVVGEKGMFTWVESVSKRAVAPGQNLLQLADDLSGRNGSDAASAARRAVGDHELASLAKRGVRGVAITVAGIAGEIRSGEFDEEIRALAARGIRDPNEILRRIETALAMAAVAAIRIHQPAAQAVIETDMSAAVREGGEPAVSDEIASLSETPTTLQPRVAGYLFGRNGVEARSAVDRVIYKAVHDDGAVPQIGLDFGPHMYALTVKGFAFGVLDRINSLRDQGATPEQLREEVRRLSQSIDAVSVEEFDDEPGVGADALIDVALAEYEKEAANYRAAVVPGQTSEPWALLSDAAEAAEEQAEELRRIKGKVGAATAKLTHEIYLHIFHDHPLPEREIEAIYGDWLLVNIHDARGVVRKIQDDTGEPLIQRFMVAAPSSQSAAEGSAPVRSVVLAGGWAPNVAAQTHAFTGDELAEFESFLAETGLPRREIVTEALPINESASGPEARLAYARTAADTADVSLRLSAIEILRTMNQDVIRFLGTRGLIPSDLDATRRFHSRPAVSLNDVADAVQTRVARRMADQRTVALNAILERLPDQTGPPSGPDTSVLPDGPASNRSVPNRIGLGLTFLSIAAILAAGLYFNLSSGDPIVLLAHLTGFLLAGSVLYTASFLSQAWSLSRGYWRSEPTYSLIPEFHDLDLLPDPSGPATSVIHNHIRLNPHLFDTRRNLSRISERVQRSILAEELRHIRYRESRGFDPAMPRSLWSLAVEEFVVNTVTPIHDLVVRRTTAEAPPRRRDPPVMDLQMRDERIRLRGFHERLVALRDNPSADVELEDKIFISDQHGTIDVFDALILDAILSVHPIDGVVRLDPSEEWSIGRLDSVIVDALRAKFPDRVPAGFTVADPQKSLRDILLDDLQLGIDEARQAVRFQNPLALGNAKRYGADVARRAAELEELGFEFKLNPDKTLRSQLAPFGFSLSMLKGKVWFHNIGDFMDRGPYGIKILRRSRELIDAGLSDLIVGNHDLWTMMNLMGLHLPFYRGFQFYGYKDHYDAEHGNVAALVAEHHDRDPETLTRTWWASRLAEFTRFHETKQKDLWNGTVDRRINGEKDAKKKHVKGTGLYDKVSPTLRADHKHLWDKLRGWYLVDVYTGTRAVGSVSIRWWEELLADFTKAYAEVRVADRGQKLPAHEAWAEAIDMIEHEILPQLRSDLEAHLAQGEWWWRVFEAVNYKNYTSPEWWAKDWVFHEGWGPTVLKELNEIERAEKGETAVEVTPSNYFENAVIEEAANFYKTNFTLFGRDIHQNTYMHAFLPVDLDGDGDGRIAGEFHFTYKGVEYRGKGSSRFPSIWEGLSRIQEDVRHGRSLSEINEALDLVNSWYADNTTVIKPPNVVEAINKFGSERLAELNGFNRLYTGHIPFHEFSKISPEKLGIVTGFQTEGRIIFTDHGMGVRFGSRGGYVVSSARRGLFLRGREMASAPGIVDHPRTLQPIEAAEGTTEQVLFHNPGIDAATYLDTLISDVERRMDEIDAEFARAARSFANRIALALPFFVFQGAVILAAVALNADVSAVSVAVFLAAANVVPAIMARQAWAVLRAARNGRATVYGLVPEAARYPHSDFLPARTAGAVIGGQITLNYRLLERMPASQQRSVVREEERHLRYQEARGYTPQTSRSRWSLAWEEAVVNFWYPIADLFRPAAAPSREESPASTNGKADVRPPKPSTPPSEEHHIEIAERTTPDWVKSNRSIDLSNKGAFTVRITRENLEEYSESNPAGLGLRKWLSNYKKEARISTAGIRGPNNILYPHDTRNPIHLYGIMLATLGKALVLKERYPGRPLHKLAASEVRYNSRLYVELIARVQAAQGITTHVTEGFATLTIWITSFLSFMWKLVGAEYVTSSHGISTKNATKDLTDEGGQFLPEESEQFVKKIEEIFEAIERDGAYEIPIAAADSPLIDRGLLARSEMGTNLYVDYLRKGIASARNLSLIRGVAKKIVIDAVGGSMHRMMVPIFSKLDIGDSFSWLHAEQDPFFHGIGKEWTWDAKNGRWTYNDLSADTSITKVDGSGRILLPVIETMAYDRKLADRPVGTVILMTDPDGDRLITCQIEPADRRAELDRLGIAHVEMPGGRLLAVYMPNQSFLLTMAFQADSLKKAGVWNNHPRFIIKTTASAASWDEWAAANGVQVVNVPVGFKEIAAMMRKVEKQIAENPDADVVVEDIFGAKINLGRNPRLLFAGEESGGEIFGPEELIEGYGGRKAIAMREKSAGEALVITAALAADMEGQGRYLSDYLNDVFEANGIVRRYDYRHDQNYYNESEPDPAVRDAAKAAGEKLKAQNETYFLSIALAVRTGKITNAQAVRILAEAFPDLDFVSEGSRLELVDFVGDGSFLLFQDKFVEIRPSGTDAKSKGYAAGKSKPEAIRYAVRLASYDGARNPLHRAFISDADFESAKERSLDLYDEFARRGAPDKRFEPETDDAYLLDPANYGSGAARSLWNRITLMIPFLIVAAALLFAGAGADSGLETALFAVGFTGSLAAPAVLSWQWFVLARAGAHARRGEAPGALHWAVERYADLASDGGEAGVVRDGEIMLRRDLLARMSIAQQRSVIAEEIRHRRYQRRIGVEPGAQRDALAVYLEEFVVNFVMPLLELVRPDPEIANLRRSYSPEDAVDTARRSYEGFDRIVRELEPATSELRVLMTDFIGQMRDGIQGRPRSLEMIRTEATFPSGKEKEFIIALDWGGSTARLALWELRGGGVVRRVKTLPDYLFTDDEKRNPRGLYPMLTDRIEELISSLSPSDRMRPFTVVVGFAFPPSQWSKGWSDPNGVKPMTQSEHKDRLNAEFSRRGLGNLRAEKGENDTLDPMMIETYERRAADAHARPATISVILGTGHNIAAEIDGVIWNFESGAFSGVRRIETSMDRETDRNSDNAGQHLLEKMVAGGYVGELLRTSLLRLRREHGLFAWNGEAFAEPYELPSKLVSDLAESQGNREAIDRLLAPLGVKPRWIERAILWKLAETILDRSARVTAMELAATLTVQDGSLAKEHFIPIEGSVFEKAPRYPERLMNALVELLGEDARRRIHLIPNHGRAGSGTAVLAAVAARRSDVGARSPRADRAADESLQIRDEDFAHPGLPTDKVSVDPDGGTSVRYPAVTGVTGREGMAVDRLGREIEMAEFMSWNRLRDVELRGRLVEGGESGRASYLWTFGRDGSEIYGQATLALENGMWSISVRTSVPQLTDELLGFLVGRLTMSGMIDPSAGFGAMRNLGNRLWLALSFVAPAALAAAAFMITGTDPFGSLWAQAVWTPLVVWSLGALPFAWQAFWIARARRPGADWMGLDRSVGSPAFTDLGSAVVAATVRGIISVNFNLMTALPPAQQRSTMREERRHQFYQRTRGSVRPSAPARAWEEWYVNVAMPILEALHVIRVPDLDKPVSDSEPRNIPVRHVPSSDAVKIKVTVVSADEGSSDRPRVVRFKAPGLDAGSRFNRGGQRFPDRFGRGSWYSDGNQPPYSLNADLVGALGLTLAAMGVPAGLALVAGSLAGWIAVWRGASRARVAVAGIGTAGAVLVIIASPLAGAVTLASVAAARIVAGFAWSRIAARAWLAEGRRYASAASRAQGPSLVDALDAAAPRGLIFGDRTANDLRNAALAGFAASAAGESDPSRRLLQWSALAGYRRALASNGAAGAVERLEETRRTNKATRVTVYHVNQLGSAEILEDELRELELVAGRIARERADGLESALVIAVSPGIPSKAADRLALIAASARGAAVVTGVSDDLRQDGSTAYSYEKLLRKASASADLAALSSLVDGNYDDAAFVTFSKIPSQFLADGRLRAIWTLLANIGAGWTPLPVDTMIRAATLARQSA